ncbi:CpsB/CapC family capsule biosynthesis tyrosine phosphatase, partial [Neobacillus niacini]|uniref:tyrosine-protein phosphatase n=1 Tax=Neobacillus niacini TaxID=86668 RepID=UPI002FFD7FD7
YKHHLFENDYQNILKMVEEVNRLLKEGDIPLNIYPGIEFHLHEDIRNDIENNIEQFLTLNNTGKYLLMEPPSSYYPSYTEEILYDLQSKGFKPILAHPERNKILRTNPSKIYDLVQQGILVQVTAGSITGLHGKRLKNFSLHLLNHDLVHFVSSDAHHYLRRKFELICAYKWIEENYSLNYRKYLEENAIHVLHGTDFKICHPKMIGKRRQYFFFYNHPLNQVTPK